MGLRIFDLLTLEGCNLKVHQDISGQVPKMEGHFPGFPIFTAVLDGFSRIHKPYPYSLYR